MDSPPSPSKDAVDAAVASVHEEPLPEFRLYKRRFVGLVGVVVLAMVSAMEWVWFGPISNNAAAELGITLDQVNWLGTIVALIYLPTALIIPTIVSRYSFRRCCDIGTVMLLIGAWIRYAGTAKSLSGGRAYALLFIGQIIGAVSQPVFQCLGPKYSETWFDLKGRTTATMIVAVANPLGGALGQLISPLVGDTRQSVLVLSIISTVACPFVFLIASAPPIPPTFSASQETGTMWELLRSIGGKVPSICNGYMTLRERVDFLIVTMIFGVLTAAANSFAILTNQYFSPVGYSSDISGLMGATLLLAGIVAAFVTAPLFDRVLTHHLAVTSRVLVPIVCAAWLSLVWAVRPNNTGAIFAVLAVTGITSITMLPVGLELACDLSRNSDASASLLWFTCNLLTVIFVQIQSALRASDLASPPLNMKRALLFNGAFCMGSGVLIFLLRGKQKRKELDEQKLREVRALARPPA